MSESTTTPSRRTDRGGEGTGDGLPGQDDGCSLLLFVSGASTPSARAIRHVQEMCERHLGDRYLLKVIDLHQDPDLARAHRVLATPTLVKDHPGPERMLVGQFDDYPRTLGRLGIEPWSSTLAQSATGAPAGPTSAAGAQPTRGPDAG